MFSIDYRDARPIYEQLAEKIEKFAMNGALKPDEQLPSVRQMAMDLSINPNTIQKAYSTLDTKGIVYSIKGRGVFISPDCSKQKADRIEQIGKEVKKLIFEARDIGVKKEEIETWIEGEEN